MLAGMIEVHDENGSGELFGSHIPDPDGAIPQNHFEVRPGPTALEGFAIDAARKLLGGLNSAGVSGGIGVANGTAVGIDTGRGEYGPQFDFASVSRLALHFADPAQGLFLDHRDARTVYFHVDNGNRRSQWNGQLELDTTLDFDLFQPHNFGADLFGLTLHG